MKLSSWMYWSTSAAAKTNASPGKIWELWSAVGTWQTWDTDVEWSRLDGDFLEGTQGVLKPKGDDTMIATEGKYHHGDLRNALVAAAVRLIEEAGPSAFSLREAARDVGVSANAAYRHFEDKSALMTAAAADGFEQLAQRMIIAMESETRRSAREQVSIVRFKAVGRAYIEFAEDHPELFQLMFGMCGKKSSSERVRHPAEPEKETPWTLLGRTLDALVIDGLLPRARRPGTEMKAWTVVHGFASLALVGNVRFVSAGERKALIESVLDFAVMGLCGMERRNE